MGLKYYMKNKRRAMTTDVKKNKNITPIIRATAIVIKDGSILLLEQKSETGRGWSLPGGKVEYGETLKEAVQREVKEETGIQVLVNQLLYICDNILPDKHVIHMTFLCKQVGGEITNNNNDSVTIHSVSYKKIADLENLGFAKKFVDLVTAGFPNKGSYMGAKANIGL